MLKTRSMRENGNREARVLSVEVLTQEEINERLKDLSGWAIKGKVLTKTFAFNSKHHATEFSELVADIAETVNHHPTITIDQSNVTLITHSEGGITERDFAFAAQVEDSVELEEE